MAKQNILLRAKKKRAMASFKAGRYDEAWLLCRALCEADRLDPELRLVCGVIAGRRSQHELAETFCMQALELDPRKAEAHFNLGIALRHQGKLGDARDAFRRAVLLRPAYFEALDALAQAHVSLYEWSAAEDILREIVALWPRKAEMLNNLGSICQAMGRATDAIQAYERALQINPRLPGALNNLGSSHLGQGAFSKAEDCFRNCLIADPGDLRARSNLLMLLNYVPDASQGDVYREHCEWGRQARRKTKQLAERARESHRSIRLGFVSSDFREHSVASFIEPVLRNLGADFDVYCYSDLPNPDATTARIRASVGQWRDIHALSDEAAAQKILSDEIDVLVDLAGHTGNNRLPLFAAQSAPVQMTYLGYPNTTGLDCIQYRITDDTADPQGQDQYFTERLLRLPGCFLTYAPEPDAPDVAPLPALRNGHITFGSFNNFSKINGQLIRLWAAVLERVDGARLLLKCPALSDSLLKERVLAAFSEFGIPSERLDLRGHTPTRREHLTAYAAVDVALDTFPYNGTTTTCEALWMGVPVLSLEGQHHAARVGASLLKAVGLTEDWLAESPDDYVRKAVAAADVLKLAPLRAALRERLAHSPLCDGKGFAEQLGSEIRRICEMPEDTDAATSQVGRA